MTLGVQAFEDLGFGVEEPQSRGFRFWVGSGWGCL